MTSLLVMSVWRPDLRPLVRRVLVAGLVLAAVDSVWFHVVGKRTMYLAAAEAVQGQRPVQFRWPAAVAAYVALALVVALYSGLPVVGPGSGAGAGAGATHPAAWVAPPTWTQVLRTAGGLGLLIYGIYNATTAALLHDYPWEVAVQDTLWGGLAVGTAALVLWYFGW